MMTSYFNGSSPYRSLTGRSQQQAQSTESCVPAPDPLPGATSLAPGSPLNWGARGRTPNLTLLWGRAMIRDTATIYGASTDLVKHGRDRHRGGWRMRTDIARLRGSLVPLVTPFRDNR